MSKETMQWGNVLANVPEQIPAEIFEEILLAGNVRIERIISAGQTTPQGEWYDQEQHEWVMVLQGRARLLLQKFGAHAEDVTVSLAAGDYLNIPAHVRHRVIWTDQEQPTLWLAVHYDVAPG